MRNDFLATMDYFILLGQLIDIARETLVIPHMMIWVDLDCLGRRSGVQFCHSVVDVSERFIDSQLKIHNILCAKKTWERGF